MLFLQFRVHNTENELKYINKTTIFFLQKK